jgi:hypothetical protein
MAYGNFILDKGYDAASVLTKFRAVKFHANPEAVTAITGATDLVHGVSQFDVTTAELAKNKGASVRVDGVTEWEAGGAITKGAFVTIDSAGRCVAAATGNKIWGQAWQAASTSGDRVAVQLLKAGGVMP